MGYYCTVPQCTSLAGKTKNVKFHRFPRDENMADKWNQILKRGKPYTKYSKVCSLHFTQADYNLTSLGSMKTLNKDAVPSLNLPKLNPDGSVMTIRKPRTVKAKTKSESDIVRQTEWTSPCTTLASPLHSVSNMSCQDVNDSLLRNRLNGYGTTVTCENKAQKQKQDAYIQTDPLDTQKKSLPIKTEDSTDNYQQEQIVYSEQYQSNENVDSMMDNNYPICEKTSQDYQNYHGYSDNSVVLVSEADNFYPIKEEVVADGSFNLSPDSDVGCSDDGSFLAKEQFDTTLLLQHQQRLIEQYCRKDDFKSDAVHKNAYFNSTNERVEGINESMSYSRQQSQEEFCQQPGPELLIAKQNALAAHTGLWTNSIKRPFFYSESQQYATSQLMHNRFEDMARILNP